MNGLSRRSSASREHAHLADDLAGGQVAHEPHLAGQAEGARHRAADLGRDAEGHGRRVGDEDRLDAAGRRRVAAGTSRCRPIERSRATMAGVVSGSRAPSAARSSRDRSVIACEVGDARGGRSSGRSAGRESARCPRSASAASSAGARARRDPGRAVGRGISHDAKTCPSAILAPNVRGLFAVPYLPRARTPCYRRARARNSFSFNSFAATVRHRPAPASIDLVEFTDRSRRSRQRPSSPHRADDARALGQHRRVADARVAARDATSAAASRTSSSTCSSRARRPRSAEDIAQAIDSIGGQLDAFTAKEYASYYIKVLDEHLPLARRHPLRHRPPPGLRARRHRAREEGHPRRDQDGRGHARRSRPRALHAGVLGGSPAGPADSRHAARRSSRSTRDAAARLLSASAYTPRNLIVSAVGNLEHARVRDLVERDVRRSLAVGRRRLGEQPPDGGPEGR